MDERLISVGPEVLGACEGVGEGRHLLAELTVCGDCLLRGVPRDCPLGHREVRALVKRCDELCSQDVLEVVPGEIRADARRVLSTVAEDHEPALVGWKLAEHRAGEDLGDAREAETHGPDRRALAGGVRRRQATTVSVREAHLAAAWAVQRQTLDPLEGGVVGAGDIEGPPGGPLGEPPDHPGLWGHVCSLEGEGEATPGPTGAHGLPDRWGLWPVDDVVDRRALGDHPVGQALQIGEKRHHEVPAAVGLGGSVAAEEHLAAALTVEKLEDASTAAAGDLGLVEDAPDRPACRAVLGRHLIAVGV